MSMANLVRKENKPPTYLVKYPVLELAIFCVAGFGLSRPARQPGLRGIRTVLTAKSEQQAEDTHAQSSDSLSVPAVAEPIEKFVEPECHCLQNRFRWLFMEFFCVLLCVKKQKAVTTQWVLS